MCVSSVGFCNGCSAHESQKREWEFLEMELQALEAKCGHLSNTLPHCAHLKYGLRLSHFQLIFKAGP